MGKSHRARARHVPAEGASGDDEFSRLLDQSFGTSGSKSVEGTVVKGVVLGIENDDVVVDIGLKSEGRVPLREFSPGPSLPGEEVRAGDIVEVYLERIENAHGDAVLSREKARREAAWEKLGRLHATGQKVEGTILGRVKGGFTVDISGALAFLPGSQVDIRPMRDTGSLLNRTHQFRILKMDSRRGNIVVSRRVVLEESQAEARSELLSTLHEGKIVDGIVKNTTGYGAFVDLGGIDGLLHVTDISWRRVNHPSEAFSVGQQIRVQIIRLNPETQRISLGMKQLEADPWEGITERYPTGTKFTGRVTNITDYGAFVELEPGVEGLVHISEMSWVKKNVHPGKIVSTSQEVEAMVLGVDTGRRRISLGLRQCQPNPWETFLADFPVGSVVTGEVRNIADFGLFVGLECSAGPVDGMVHLTDLSWTVPGEQEIRKYRKGDRVQAQVLDVDVAKERISLGIRQLGTAPAAGAAGIHKGDVVSCTVTGIQENGVVVALAGGLSGLVRRGELSRDHARQDPALFPPGTTFSARVTGTDGPQVTLSVKSCESDGNDSAGGSLGNILGAAIARKQEENAPGEPDGTASAPDPAPDTSREDDRDTGEDGTTAQEPGGGQRTDGDHESVPGSG